MESGRSDVGFGESANGRSWPVAAVGDGPLRSNRNVGTEIVALALEAFLGYAWWNSVSVSNRLQITAPA